MVLQWTGIIGTLMLRMLVDKKSRWIVISLDNPIPAQPASGECRHKYKYVSIIWKEFTGQLRGWYNARLRDFRLPSLDRSSSQEGQDVKGLL